MDATLRALGELLIKAIPTFLLVLLLHLYLKRVFFGPLARVLEQREQATEGTRRRAEQLLARASALTAEYEEAIRAARAEIYREQEAARQQWQQEHERTVTEARERARAMIERARAELEADLAEARVVLESRSRQLAARIADTVLGGRAA
ncbi:MAG: ATP synthase F0 subunit B [Bryobacteraceae bacterium]